ncbi:MAG: hypothetical protein EOO04_29360 [Chitinophagaceae bacterium]|nr:MAG: hypothetical protein EOO04_29360 [Chitinophagaceae bacterium]
MKFKMTLFAAMIAVCALQAQTKPEVLTNKGVIELSKAGFGKDMILSKIESSNCKFDLSTTAMIELKKQGVSEDVVKAMMDQSSTGTSARSGGPSASQGSGGSANTGKKVTAASAKNSKSLASSVDLMNHVYSYEKSNMAVVALDKAVAGIRTKQGPFGGSIMLHVDGAKSPTRVSANSTFSFVINTGSAALPELVLYKLKPGKNKREVASMKVNSFSGVKTGEDVISLNISKLEEGIFLITPVKALIAGEYFFSGKPVANATSTDAYTFGVD